MSTEIRVDYQGFGVGKTPEQGAEKLYNSRLAIGGKLSCLMVPFRQILDATEISDAGEMTGHKWAVRWRRDRQLGCLFVNWLDIDDGVKIVSFDPDGTPVWMLDGKLPIRRTLGRKQIPVWTHTGEHDIQRELTEAESLRMERELKRLVATGAL